MGRLIGLGVATALCLAFTVALMLAQRARRIKGPILPLLAAIMTIVAAYFTISEWVSNVLTQEPAILPRPSMQVYDTFNGSCIRTSLWRNFVVDDTTLRLLSSNNCWDLEAYGFEQRDGRLYITGKNPATKKNRGLYLVGLPDKEFTDLEIDFTVQSVLTGFGAVGMQFNLGKSMEKWGEYGLVFGGDWDIHKGYVVFQSYNSALEKVQLEKAGVYSFPATVKLRLHWDGTNLHFYVDEREVMTKPIRGYGRSFAIACGMGWNMNRSEYVVKGYIDELRIKYR